MASIGEPVKVIQVRAPSRTYPVLVGYGVTGQLPGELKKVGIEGALHVVTDSLVAPLWWDKLKSALKDAEWSHYLHVVPAGEGAKGLAQAAALYDEILQLGVERRDAVVALGGGVVGDLAGFVAATLLRGIAFVQLPTTLLAQVDASIGGKVGINHPIGKNLIGAFHQPHLVLTDLQFLHTLPPRETRAGWAEVIKMAAIMDADLFCRLEEAHGKLSGVTARSSEPHGEELEIVARSIELKAQVVSEDETEGDLRRILNFGHTVGHAIEAAACYRGILHGEAVAIGMRAAAELSCRMGMLDRDSINRLTTLLREFSLPVDIASMARALPEVTPEKVMAATLHDKKMGAGHLHWVLLSDIGDVAVRADIPEPLVQEVIQEVVAGR